jgi:hypothetical protein
MRVSFEEKLVSLECVACSITFAVTDTVERQLRSSQRSFECPNGHTQSFKGVLEVERLKEQIAGLESRLAERDQRLQERYARIEELRRQNASLRGVITRFKNNGAK